MQRSTTLFIAALALTLTGCIEDESFVPPGSSNNEQLFQRYMALGNSLTAGYMSGGINDSTQHLAYPVLLAERAGAGFGVPSLIMPGCPPPLVGVIEIDAAGVPVLEEDRVGGGSAGSCSLRGQPVPQFVQNLAVPGAKVADAVDIDRPGNASNPLTQLILGGLSQTDALRRSAPTFVTSWLGNNDALGAALLGDTTLLTPLDTFEVYYNRVAQAIGASDAIGAALIGVIDVTIAPVLQPGLYYWLADSLGFAPRPLRGGARLTVNDNCGPTDAATGLPNPLSMNEVSALVYRDGSVQEISCDPDAPYVLTEEELEVIQARVVAYNAIISDAADDRDWVYVDATDVLEQELQGAGGNNRLRLCTALTNTLTPANMVTIVENRCPHPSAPNFFGSLVTYDGIHMSADAHEVLADGIAAQIEGPYGLDL
jgi:hypothetical protein